MATVGFKGLIDATDKIDTQRPRTQIYAGRTSLKDLKTLHNYDSVKYW